MHWRILKFLGHAKAGQGNVNGPSPSLVGMHTSFPGLSEGIVITVSAAAKHVGPEGVPPDRARSLFGNRDTYIGPKSSLYHIILEALVTGISTLVILTPSFTVEGAQTKRSELVLLCRRLKT